MARIPVSGVRTSCANAASAASTMPGPAAAAARLRTTPDARFFGDRRFGGGVLRGVRDLGAMIPLTLAVPTMPWPGFGSHADGWFSPGPTG